MSENNISKLDVGTLNKQIKILNEQVIQKEAKVADKLLDKIIDSIENIDIQSATEPQIGFLRVLSDFHYAATSYFMRVRDLVGKIEELYEKENLN